eukprot:scaffold682_cov363-Pavlova_lutheri.AAC.10
MAMQGLAMWMGFHLALAVHGTEHADRKSLGRTMSEGDGGWRAAQAGDVVFNEAMIDDANGRADWIEFKNVRDVEVDIRQLVLSDRDEGLELVLGQPGCPESIPAGGYLVLSRDSDGDDPCKFEFGLGNKEQLILRQGDVLVDSVAWNDEDIPTGKPIGKFPDGVNNFKILQLPTPHFPNVVEYQTTESLKGADETVLLSPYGPVGAFSKSYVEHGIGEIAGFKSNLPLVVVRTADGRGVTNEERILGHMWISSCLQKDPFTNDDEASVVVSSSVPSETRCTPYDYPDYDGKIGLNIRGRSSQLYPKKQYRMELWSEGSTSMEDRDDVNHVLLGLPADDDWIIHGPYVDRSFMRNTLAFELSRSMGHWAPRWKYVELYLNQSGEDEMKDWQYDGLYYIGETIKRGDHRVNVELQDGEADTSFIIEISNEEHHSRFSSDGWAGDCAAFVYGPSLVELDYPKARDATCDQKDFVYDYVRKIDDAMQTLSGVEELIDVDSWIDYFLHTELTKNRDGFVDSVFFHKEKGTPLKAGPVWDLNLAFGNFGSRFAQRVQGWQFRFRETARKGILPGWYERLVNDSTFKSRLQARWTELREGPFSDDVISGFIAEQKGLLMDAQKRNYDRWDLYRISSNHLLIPVKRTEGSFEEEVNYLERFVLDRARWMDANLSSL